MDIPAASYLLFGFAIAWCHMLLIARWERLQAERKARRLRGVAYWQALLDSERTSVCSECNLPLFRDGSAWVDASGGDVCCAEVFTEVNTDGVHTALERK